MALIPAGETFSAWSAMATRAGSAMVVANPMSRANSRISAGTPRSMSCSAICVPSGKSPIFRPTTKA